MSASVAALLGVIVGSGTSLLAVWLTRHFTPTIRTKIEAWPPPPRHRSGS